MTSRVECIYLTLRCLFPLQRDMLDVSQIMRDLASMVHEQGDAIGETSRVCVCVCVYACVYLGLPELLCAVIHGCILLCLSFTLCVFVNPLIF